ncbi:hypothetical protein ABKN59_010321 [Abortiporus biennis]
MDLFKFFDSGNRRNKQQASPAYNAINFYKFAAGSSPHIYGFPGMPPQQDQQQQGGRIANGYFPGKTPAVYNGEPGGIEIEKSNHLQLARAPRPRQKSHGLLAPIYEPDGSTSTVSTHRDREPSRRRKHDDDRHRHHDRDRDREHRHRDRGHHESPVVTYKPPPSPTAPQPQPQHHYPSPNQYHQSPNYYQPQMPPVAPNYGYGYSPFAPAQGYGYGMMSPQPPAYYPQQVFPHNAGMVVNCTNRVSLL